MLTTRKADIVAEADRIAALLRSTFGSEQFTPGFLVWKHHDNPMGRSFVLVVEDGDRLVGLRCFMFWKVEVGGKKLRAIRPVDTAVHPDMQGKGLFKKMTLQGLEMVKGEYDIVFNTPNSNSLPGYLKMGWSKLSQQFPVYTALRPFFAARLPFSISRTLPSSGDAELLQFIQWRYTADYYKWAVFKDGTVLIYRVEKKKGMPLLILVDVFFAVQEIKQYVNSVCSAERSFLIMFLENRETRALKGTFAIKMRDLVVVGRNDEALPVGDFNFSLGDLEGIM